MNHWEEFKKNNSDLWHFDASRKEQNYTLVGNLEADFQDLIELTEKESAFTKVVLANPSEHNSKEVSSKIQGFKDWGYNEHNTITHQIYNHQFPEIFSRYMAVTNLINPTSFIIKQNCGQSLPWHYDTFYGYISQNNLKDDKEVCRYLIFLEDWEWGHAFFSGNSIIHQWKKGDIVKIPYRMHHASCNVGMTPKLTLLITGIDNESALHHYPASTYRLPDKKLL